MRQHPGSNNCVEGFIRHSIRNSTTPMLLSALSSAVSRIGVSPQASASNTIKNVRFASKNWRSAFRSSFSTCSMFPDAQMIISLKDSGSFTEMGKFHDTDMARSLSKSRMRRPIDAVRRGGWTTANDKDGPP